MMRPGYKSLALVLFFFVSVDAKNFHLEEATIDEIHAAYKSGELTCRRLVQLYLDRIGEYDRKGPKLTSIITVNPEALAEADRQRLKRAGAIILAKATLAEFAAGDTYGSLFVTTGND